MRTLLVDYDVDLSRRMEVKLRKLRYGVDVAADGEEGLYAGLNYPVDIAIVDIALAKLPGLELIQHWRRQGRHFPVIVHSARPHWRDKVAALDAGADDYLCKPAEFEEVLAHLRALTRRSHGWTSAEIVCGPYVLDTAALTLRCRETYIDLTSYEYRLLEYMMHRAGQTLSSTELAAHLYSEGQERESNLVAQYIFRLRRKLRRPGVRDPIETVMRDGYRFATSADRGDSLVLRTPMARG